MEEKGHQQCDSLSNCDDNKTNKIQKITFGKNYLSKDVITYFEELSNELIYEIFEYLEFHHAYEAFYNLNIRFRNLIVNSTVPLKINIPFMSKSAFARYYTDIIISNTHRINSIHLSNPFIFDLKDSLFSNISIFFQLKTLVIDSINPDILEKLLHQLTFLSCLSSLVIISGDCVKNRSTIFSQIFHLPTLKYCKLSLPGWLNHHPLRSATNEYSPIEHLIITSRIYLMELDKILSYVPQLRRLTLDSVSKSWRCSMKTCPFVLNHLTHVSLNLAHIMFAEFEQLIINLFSTVQVLHILNMCTDNIEYSDSKRWEQLILLHMTNLRIFDIQIGIVITHINSELAIKNQINQFTSPFWIERQWFFQHQYCQSGCRKYLIFYSTNPYRRKNYRLRSQLNANISLNNYEKILKSVDHVLIQNKYEIINCMSYFPNATKLTFESSFSTTNNSIGIILNHIIPLKQLTKLVIESNDFTCLQILELLHFMPNIHTLIFESMHFNKDNYISIEQSEIFELVSSTNKITDVTLTKECTLNKLHVLIALCPRMQCLTINMRMKDIESITRFLLERTNDNNSNLSSLCFTGATKEHYQELQELVESRILPGDYTYKLLDTNLYLWW